MKKLFWIIDEEWSDYETEIEILKETFPDCEIKMSNYNYKEDLEKFGYKADGILAQVYADIPKTTIDKLENCKGIAIYGGGYDRIDIKAARNKNISVTNVQGYCAEDLADYIIAAMYLFNKKIEYFYNNLDSKFWGAPAVKENIKRLSNQKLLIIGFGTIGKILAKRVSSLGIKVLAYDEFLSEAEIKKYNVEKVSWEEGLKQADYISINLKGCDENIDKLSMKDFKLMKNTAYIINTARGKILKEDDLIEAVKNKIIAGAVLDVIKTEPPTGDEAILHCDNIIVTPHISYISEESFKDLKLKTLKNLIDMMNDKKPIDLVN